MRYAFIQDHLAVWKLRNLCRALGVSKSGFFAWRKRPPSERRERDAEVRVHLLAFHKESKGTYGSRRLMRDLCDVGQPCSRARVVRLMRAENIRVAAKALSRYHTIRPSKTRRRQSAGPPLCAGGNRGPEPRVGR